MECQPFAFAFALLDGEESVLAKFVLVLVLVMVLDVDVDDEDGVGGGPLGAVWVPAMEQLT